MRNEFDLEIALSRSRLNRIALELAEVKAELAAKRFAYELKKYNANQPRAPRGTPTGGQWVDAGGGNSSRQGRAPPIAATPKVKVPRSIPRNAPAATEATPAVARAVGLPLAAGVVGVSRAAGTFENATTGRSVTPVLKVPFTNSPATAYEVKPRDWTTAGPSRSGGGWENGYADDDECEEARDAEIRACPINAATYGRTAQERRELFGICRRVAMKRYAECRAAGSLAGRKTPPFVGGFRGTK